MAEVVMYTTMFCPFCVRAKRLLKDKGITFEEIDVMMSAKKRAQMMEVSGGYTVPQILINGEPIGGCDELYALEHAGELDAKLGLAA
ncbi:MAG: glutaredoxin 3 [Alphaproteobacteria bacterium]|jgi:glutaredoxin 3|nr:glutaredoxin 3 [Rhodospirillaceae bacterium]MBT6203636.1 glutaredoxin 3 [Rhodospirillaceae bacterium]MBT6510737.1 glutaredoxin 3 [Rhodospirillaceae bacterium]MBT7648540.1 glutaredoxin 3 [Rhodospirillaceae bacterium]MDG2482800.1 glutaredoxin 3 [Alphaproteobacteria bacterium]